MYAEGLGFEVLNVSPIKQNFFNLCFRGVKDIRNGAECWALRERNTSISSITRFGDQL